MLQHIESYMSSCD